MVEREEVEIETEFEAVGEREYRGVVKCEALGRTVIHNYFICQYSVVEVDVLKEEGRPRAVFRSVHGPNELGDFSDESELVEKIERLALDAPRLQVFEEYEASVETFES